jgi:hypothetical protein
VVTFPSPDSSPLPVLQLQTGLRCKECSYITNYIAWINSTFRGINPSNNVKGGSAMHPSSLLEMTSTNLLGRRFPIINSSGYNIPNRRSKKL